MSYVEFRLRGKHRNEVVTVDEADWPLVSQYRWYGKEVKGSKTLYARTAYADTNCTLHRLLIPEVPEGCEIDHIDGNGLNNRRHNLSIVTRSENMLRSWDRKGRKPPPPPKIFHHVNTVWKALASGKRRPYYYDRVTGRRITEEQAMNRIRAKSQTKP